jgi:regulatory protein
MPLRRRVHARSGDAAAAGSRDLPASPEVDAEAALAKIAYRHLARRDRSRLEMQRLLASHCSNTEVVNRLLDQLQSRGWLSDVRMAGQLVDMRRARMGAQRLRQEMARRGLAPEVIAQSTVGLEQTDLEIAAALWRKRFREPAVDRKERERQIRFLLNRGFSQAIALKVLRAAGNPEESEYEE